MSSGQDLFSRRPAHHGYAKRREPEIGGVDQKVGAEIHYQPADHLRSLEESLRICETTQVTEPGTVVSYSTYGVALAGYLVEKLTGQPFYQYVNEHIFPVLGMQDTAIHPSQADNAAVAAERELIHGYRAKGREH